ncbi:glycoside hydrolase family 108 protein [Vibrio splendidus]|uniref:glycoside hydrolase family 108 protein n=1 Tax=Vibrio splendidus TaxID=29497 RepID=UPI003D0FE5DE|nr:hypothetical protein [Alteromonas sp.]
MSHFNQALDDVFRHEGGFSNNTQDKGGVTNLGISIRFLKTLPRDAGDINGDGHVNDGDIIDMHRSDAAQLYKTYFWDHYRVGEIQSQAIATKSFNCFVNMRGKTAALILQRACNDLRSGIKEDGVLGSRSFAAINRLDEHKLMACIKWRMWEVYQAIMKNDPSQEVFANGWQNRAFADV